jgi:hypothetical protein
MDANLEELRYLVEDLCLRKQLWCIRALKFRKRVRIDRLEFNEEILLAQKVVFGRYSVENLCLRKRLGEFELWTSRNRVVNVRICV